MEASETQQHTDQEDITIKDLIVKTQDWTRFLFKKWWIILLVSALGGGIGLLLAFFSKPKYAAELTFIVEDTKGGQMSNYAGLASQLGINLGNGAAGGSVFAGDNVIEFLRSRLMIERTLLASVMVDGKQLTLAEMYLNVTGLTEAWVKHPKMSRVKFPVNADRERFSIDQDSVLNLIQLSISKQHLTISKADKLLSFITVKIVSPEQRFSKLFTERLVNEAVDFYVQTKTLRSKNTVEKLQARADSIEFLLNRKTYSAAVTEDLNANPARNVARVGTELALRDKLVLQTMYAEIVKNLEFAKMSMDQQTPLIQVVDTPRLPLKKEKLGKFKGLMIGGFTGAFLIILYLVLARLYKEIMAK
ncbi:Wzz/FepE/Etk N-terminal domain-containing protein [uncultured Chitinophaga sp.]|uniref:Wzz/FepE/Etk N-terminal domain-containing protein n=1 Tax=uncultured Chitinophaga sp. TaxID=339340 RepID=UPI0025D32C3B|nr:Wzz/FepE/Etk N-terminal domain-containing protein [uncultured Chitinophaga sp.]